MILDIATVTVMIILGGALMSGGLFLVTRGPLGEIRGLRRWAAATLVQSLGWTLIGPLRGVVPLVVSVTVGYGLLALSVAFYLMVIADFTRTKVRLGFIYGTIVVQTLLLIYFSWIEDNAPIRLLVATACIGVLMLASSQRILSGPGIHPASHRLTAALFAVCGFMVLVRGAYAVMPDPHPGPHWYTAAINDATYLVFFVTATMLSFGFVLMVSDRYIAQQQEDRAALRKSEAHARAITQSAYDAIVTVDSHGRIVGWNHGARLIFGYEEGEALGQPVTLLIPERLHGTHGDAMNRMRSGAEPHILGQAVELVGRGKDGREFPVELTLSRWEGSDGWFVTAIIGEITERKQAEEAVRESLREKEALLKETHHRVKNNLALITSLMRLSASESREAETKTVLSEMQGRIHSVTLLNEMLYRSGTYTMVNLADYLSQIAAHVSRAQNADPEAVRLVLDLAPVYVETAQAIPCGLIVTELITNSLKHAFHFGDRGQIQVSLRPGPRGEVTLTVGDSGAGLPGDLAARPRDSLGLQLVRDLARQLMGDLEIGPGATFALTFTPRQRSDTTEIPPLAGLRQAATAPPRRNET